MDVVQRAGVPGMRRGAAILAATAALAACSASAPDDDVRVEVAGVSLCVPGEHRVADVGWVRSDDKAVRDGGLAVANCAGNRHSADPGRCLFPVTVGAVAVDAAARAPADRFGDPRLQGSLIHQVAVSPAAEHTLVDDGRVLAVRDPRIWRDTYLWARDGASFPADAVLAADDRLLASCGTASVRDATAPDATREVLRCRREFVAGRLTLTYSFDSPDGYAHRSAIEALDAAVVTGIDRLRCPAG